MVSHSRRFTASLMDTCQLKLSLKHPISDSAVGCFLGAGILFSTASLYSSGGFWVSLYFRVCWNAFMFKCSNRAKMLIFLWIYLQRKNTLLPQLSMINPCSSILIHCSLGWQLCLTSVLNKDVHMNQSIHLQRRPVATYFFALLNSCLGKRSKIWNSLCLLVPVPYSHNLKNSLFFLHTWFAAFTSRYGKGTLAFAVSRYSHSLSSTTKNWT